MKMKINGFSLLEISMVLVISSILLGISFESAKFFLLHNHIETTKIKLNTVQEALDIYLIENGKLPCPAGLKNNSETTISCENNSSIGVYVNNGIARGGIPYKELGLTADASYDAWKIKFTYSVYIIATNNVQSSRNFKKMENNYTGISIYNNSDGANNIATNKAIYSIVSHGANKLGGFAHNKNTVNSLSGITASEEINTVETSSFLKNIYFTDVRVSNKDNDDFIRYKTRIQLMNNTNIDEVLCYINQSGVNSLINEYNNLNETDIEDKSSVAESFLEYDGIRKQYLIDNETNSHYSLKCYKYGRLGIFKDD